MNLIDINLFLSSFNSKGNIAILSENEVSYLKTIMKSRTENWDRTSTLADIYRHCKYTIRMLTRQMANIDNRRVFRKNRNEGDASHHKTHFIVYRAWVLY